MLLKFFSIESGAKMKRMSKWLLLGCFVCTLLPMSLRAEQVGKSETTRRSIFGTLFQKVAPADAFENFTIWRDKSGKELWAR